METRIISYRSKSSKMKLDIMVGGRWKGTLLFHCTPDVESIYPIPLFKDGKEDFNYDIPCWSLAALLDIIPDSIYDNTNEFSQLEFSKRSIAYHDLNDGIKIGSLKDNLIDACYEVILKLHELNLL